MVRIHGGRVGYFARRRLGLPILQSVPLVALVATLRAAKRRDPSWSMRAAVRRRGGHLALPLELLHSLLGKRRVHQLERFFRLLD